MRILVTGATGNVGRPTVAALARRGHVVRAAATRAPEGLSGAAEPVALDLADPSTWGAALDGADGLFLLRPPAISDIAATLAPFTDEAVRRGVRHIVFLSVVGAGQVRFIPHRKVEDHLRTLPVPWTFLRAGFFLQNLETAYRTDLARDDRLYVPAGRGLVAWVDAADLGEAAAIAFDRPDARGAAWTLTGPEARTFAEVAAIASDVLGRPIRYVPASLVGYARHLRRAGLPWAQIGVQTALHTAIRLGREGVVDPTLAELLGRRPTALADYLRREAAIWAR